MTPPVMKVFDFVDDLIDGFDRRPRQNKDWIGIVIHHTGIGGRKNVDESMWRKLHRNIAAYLGRQDKIYVSAHFQIGRFGELTQIVNPDFYVAYHAGVSKHWHPILRREVNSMNDHMIGIELLGDGNDEPYSDDQYKALTRLCAELMKRYLTIQPHCITGHEVVSPGRKFDPGLFFDWRRFFKQLYQQY